MGFLAICTALYDYQAQAENELEIKEGELLYILEKSSNDDWWKAKKRAAPDEEEEPVGLIPNNYVEDATPTHSAKALYDYTRQTEEEVSFTEEASLEVFDTSDPDWTLVGVSGDYGFAPANYIELLQESTPKSPPAWATQRVPTTPSVAETTPSPVARPPADSIQGPAASLARVLGGGASVSPLASRAAANSSAPRQQHTPEPSDGEDDEPAPALPQRPASQSLSPPPTQHAFARVEEAPGVLPSPPYNRAVSQEPHDASVHSAGGFRLYNINEMVSSLGRRRKMPVTFGLNLATGTIMFSPERTRDGPSQEWSADKMEHCSIEGKHVFIELIRPSKSLDLHAGTSETAEEIVAALGELAGAVRGEGIREVIAAASSASGQKKGQMVYEFVAQGDDEVTVAVGDEIIVLDDAASDEWWKVRRVKNGKEGVVPSSYIEVTGTVSTEPQSRTGINAGRSTVEQNRLEEERLSKQAAHASRPRGKSASEEVGPGVRLPQRGSSLAEEDSRRSSHKDRRSNRSNGKSSRPRPDSAKVRTWTDRSGTFKVEAEFIGLTDGKIHLHKVNGVKIAVPTSKMAAEDLEYVEQATGKSLDEDKPLSEIQRKNRAAAERTKAASSTTGASVEKPKAPEYDWFDFFLKAGVGPHQCERYAQAMTRDSMDESVLPDVTDSVLRSLGLKEGDILKVMKFLDNKLGRTAKNGSAAVGVNGDADTNGPTGGLFSGPGGALRNNTRRGRPESNRQASDVVDAKVFEQQEAGADSSEPAARETLLASAPRREKVENGFDDDAWEVKPSRPAATTAQTAPAQPAASAQPSLTGALADLSLLKPLEPTRATPQQMPQPVPSTSAVPAPAQPASASPQPTQPAVANPNFFSQLNPQQTGVQPHNVGYLQTSQTQQPNGIQQQIPQLNPPRQRPPPPQQTFGAGSLLPPPPRPLSAPQNLPQQNRFGLLPLQPQLTGIPQTSPVQVPPGHSLNELNQQRFQQQYGQPQLQPQLTGFPQQGPALAPFTTGLQMQQTRFQPQPTGFQPQQQQPQQQQQQFGGFQLQQPYFNGNAVGSPFADPRPSYQSSLAPQQTGYGGFQRQGPPSGGINSVLPPALQPQPTAFVQQQQQPAPFQQPQQTGFPQQQQPVPFQQPQQTAFQGPQQTGFGPQPPAQNGFPNPAFQPPPIPQQPTIAPLQPQKTGPAPPVRFGVSEPKKLVPQPTGRRADLSQATPQNPFGLPSSRA